MVSSIGRLLCGCLAAACNVSRNSNACATAGPAPPPLNGNAGLLPLAVAVALATTSSNALAQEAPPDPPVNRITSTASFLAGACTGLVAHEGGHLLFDVVFDADPTLKRVEFHGLPFFALTHRNELSPRREFAVSSAGFWVQHATNEWILTATPTLRDERAPFRKGLLAFNVITSLAYSGAAFARTGPYERDTRGMADSARVDEPWIGALILGPAVMDAWRYFDPDAKWAVWVSRALKISGVLLILR